METATQTQDLTEQQKNDVILFLELNRYSNSYYQYIKLPQGDYNPYLDRPNLKFEDQNERTIEKALNDINLIKEAEQEYKKRKGFKIGEVIKLPNGKSTHITHIWDDGQIQTGHLGSCHLSRNGYISRSGSLDSGLKASALIPTKETEKHNIWIFQNRRSGANRAVYFPIEFNVYKVKDGADFSGCYYSI